MHTARCFVLLYIKCRKVLSWWAHVPKSSTHSMRMLKRQFKIVFNSTRVIHCLFSLCKTIFQPTSFLWCPLSFLLSKTVRSLMTCRSLGRRRQTSWWIWQSVAKKSPHICGSTTPWGIELTKLLLPGPGKSNIEYLLANVLFRSLTHQTQMRFHAFTSLQSWCCIVLLRACT